MIFAQGIGRKFAFALFLIFTVFAQASAKTLTVASYNVENLFDMNNDGTEHDAFVLGRWNLSSYRIKLQNISYVISQISPDIIGLQEIESKRALDDLAARLRRGGLRYHTAFAKNQRHAIGLGLLSKYPIINVRQYAVQNSRPILRCDIDLGGDTLSVFNAHFPAKRHPEQARLRATNVLRRAIDTLAANENYEYFITGDLNSDFDEFARSLSQGTDNTGGRTGINHVLKTLRSAVGQEPIFSTPPLEKDEHFNPWTEVEAQNRWTYIFRGNRNTLDHILFPQNMTDTLGWRYVYGTLSHFFNTKITRNGVPYGWQYERNSGVHHDRGFSDHLAVFAKITNEKIGENTPREPILRDLDGLNGWITTHSAARINFVQNTPQNFAVFELRAGEISANATVAKIIAIADRDYAPLRMAVRGEGTFLVRSRKKEGEENSRWANASPATGEISGAARFSEFSTAAWREIAIRENVSAGDTLEIEFRTQANAPLNIQFCVENLNGWFRPSRGRGR